MLARLGGISPGWQRILLIAGCAVLFGVWLMWVPLTEIDEARFTEATRQMLATGDYLIPQYNGSPRYQKPILYYWLQAGSMRVFGTHEWAARLPSAVASLALVLLVHAFLLRWLAPRGTADLRRMREGRGAAFLGATALATMPLLAIWARGAVTDPTLTLFIAGALLALLQAELEGATLAGAEKRVRRWQLLAAASMALATLTKGPVGVALPAAAWLLYHLSRRSLRAAAARFPWVGGIALFLLIAAPWYVATCIVDGPGFLTHFFMKENLGRFTITMEDHGMSSRLFGLFTYLPVSLLLCFPFSAFLVHDLIAPARDDRMPLDAGVYPRLRRFGWVWIVAILGIFSLSRTQLPSYVQAIAPAAALLFAVHVMGRLAAAPAREARQRWAGRVELFLLAFLGVLWTGGLAFVLLKGEVAGPLGADPLPPAARVLAWALIAGGALLLCGIIAGIWRRSDALRIGWVMAAWAGLQGIILVGVAPLTIRSMYGPSAAAGRALSAVPTDGPILYYGDRTSESMVFYARRRIHFFTHDDGYFEPGLRGELQRAGSALVLTDVPVLPDIGLHVEIVPLGAVGRCRLVRVVPATSPK